MNDRLKVVGANLFKARKKLGLTQGKMADRCGMHWTYIGGLERGERNPTIETFIRIAEGLSIPPSRLFGREEESRGSRRDWLRDKMVKYLTECDDKTAEYLVKMTGLYIRCHKSNKTITHPTRFSPKFKRVS